MRRYLVSGRAIGTCLAFCTAAALMISVAEFGTGSARSLPKFTRALSGPHAQLLQAKAAQTPKIGTSKNQTVIERYRQFPLSFEPNREQTDSQVKFLARGEGYIFFLTNQDAVFRLGRAGQNSSVLRMSFPGASAKPIFSGMDELPGKSNYFIGKQQSQWHTDIPNYRKVAERGIYPGIDLIYYGTQRQLEYDFVISPGASPRKIQIAFKGAQNLHTDANGDLFVGMAGTDDVRLHKPIAYQVVGSKKQLVAANFLLTGKDSVEFEIGDYDSSRPLIVDPILSYSTYLGGSGIDVANAIAVAPDNTAFIVGSTFSSDFPLLGALQGDAGGGADFPQDAFVAKIKDDGSVLVYSTYLGGENKDFGNGIAVDNSGSAYVTGTTLSPHFPVTTNSFDTLCGADGVCGASWNTGGFLVTNAFVTKLNPAGSALAYSTFFGYYENVSGEAIAVDTNGNAYLTGYTTANFVPTVAITPPKLPPPPFPISSGAFQPTYGGGTTNAYIAKFDATGSTVLYSSYLGGDAEDAGYGLALDGNADAYLTGLTYSTNFPTTTGALQTAFGGAGDAFAAKVDLTASGSASLIYSTYIGGSGLDQGNGIAVDPSGNAYVTGLTNSATFGFAPNGFQTANAGEGDAFVAKLTTTGALSYFTFLGGTHADAGTGIAVDTGGNAYLTGTTVSTDFPTAGAVFQPAYGGGNADSFVAKLDPTGKTLVYSSYVGGTNTELATGIAIDTAGNAYVTGQTCSDDFPLANPLQAVPGGNCDAYVAKVSILDGFAFNPAGLVFSAQSLNTTSEPQTVTLTNGDTSYTISNIAVFGANAGDFAETTTCPTGSALGVGTTCTITVTFTPSAQGIRKASVTLTDNAPGNPHVIDLTGNTSTVTLSTSSLSFGPQGVGSSSAPQDVTVTNSGTTPLTISSITASGDFSETDDCTKAPLQPSTNCVIAVTFTPSAGVASLGAITIADNGSGSPQVVLTTGTGVPQVPTVTLSPTTLTFSAQAVGTTSAAQDVIVTNSGTTPLTVTSIAASGNFSETDNCTKTALQPGTNCVIAVTFSPTAATTSLGAVTIADNGAGSPQVVPTSGTGIPQAPTVTVSPSSLTFTSQAVGTTSTAQNISVTNTGTAALTISTVSASGNFSETDSCTKAPLQPGTNCVIAVTFSPTAANTSLGSVTITDNGIGSPQIVPTTGTGIPQAPTVTVSPTNLNFGSQAVNTSSAPQDVTVANGGPTALTITGIAASSDFSETDNCTKAPLQPGTNCVIAVTFTPTTATTSVGSVTITDNGATNPQVVLTTGTGTSQAPFVVSSLSPTAVVPAGQPAGYVLSVSSPNGFGQLVSLSCTAPKTISCSISPSAVVPSAAPSSSAFLTVNTALRTSLPPVTGIKIDPRSFLGHFGGTWLLWLLAVLAICTTATLRRRPMTAAFGFAVVLLLASVACSGGNTPGVAGGTPAGNYQITVTGTSGSVSNSTVLTVQVQ